MWRDQGDRHEWNETVNGVIGCTPTRRVGVRRSRLYRAAAAYASLLLGVVLVPALARAGTIYGTITQHKGKPAVGVRVAFLPPGTSTPAITTASGSYRLPIRYVGAGRLFVTYTHRNKAVTCTTAVRAYAKPVRYNFRIVPVASNHCKLVRR